LHDARVQANDGVMITSLEIDIKPESGGFSLHDACVVHCSEPNPNNVFRKIYTRQYATADTTKFMTDKWPIPLFLVRGKLCNLTNSCHHSKPIVS